MSLHSGVEGQGQCNVFVIASSSSDCITPSGSGLKEHNYFGFSDSSSVDSSIISRTPEGSKNNLNLKATELRLGLPGSQSPERDADFSPSSSDKLDEKQLFPLVPAKDVICSLPVKTMASGNKRGFDDTVDALVKSQSNIFTEGNWMFNTVGSDPGQPKLAGHVISNRSSATQSAAKSEVLGKTFQESTNRIGSNTASAPAAKEVPNIMGRLPEQNINLLYRFEIEVALGILKLVTIWSSHLQGSGCWLASNQIF